MEGNNVIEEVQFGKIFRRTFAHIADMALIMCVGLLIDWILFSRINSPISPVYFLALGAFAYFTIGNSDIRQGKTFGKELFGLQVVDCTGKHVDVKVAAKRQLIFCSMYFYSMLFPNNFLQLIFLSLWLVSIYLYMFNKATCQVFHDIIAKTYVTKTESAPPGSKLKLWKPNVIACWIIFGYVFLTGAFQIFSGGGVKLGKEYYQLLERFNIHHKVMGYSWKAIDVVTGKINGDAERYRQYVFKLRLDNSETVSENEYHLFFEDVYQVFPEYFEKSRYIQVSFCKKWDNRLIPITKCQKDRVESQTLLEDIKKLNSSVPDINKLSGEKVSE